MEDQSSPQEDEIQGNDTLMEKLKKAMLWCVTGKFDLEKRYSIPYQKFFSFLNLISIIQHIYTAKFKKKGQITEESAYV